MTELTLGAVLRGHRERAGLTQSGLAAQAGVSVRMLRELEKDRVTQPRPRSLDALAAALGLSGTQRQTLSAAPPALRGPSVAVLGPLEVRCGGPVLAVPAALPRRLLILLALQHEHGVGSGEIAEALWGERPPPSARNLVQTYVGVLRRLLEPDRSAASYRVLVRAGDG